jgi:rubrerythrin
MDFMSKADENIRAAVAGESLARNRYSYFAQMAKKEGYRYIAKIFEEIAENEKYHVMEELKDFARLTGNDDVHKLSNQHLCPTNSEISNHTAIEHV